MGLKVLVHEITQEKGRSFQKQWATGTGCKLRMIAAGMDHSTPKGPRMTWGFLCGRFTLEPPPSRSDNSAEGWKQNSVQ